MRIRGLMSNVQRLLEEMEGLAAPYWRATSLAKTCTPTESHDLPTVTVLSVVSACQLFVLVYFYLDTPLFWGEMMDFNTRDSTWLDGPPRRVYLQIIIPHTTLTQYTCMFDIKSHSSKNSQKGSCYGFMVST